MSNLCFIVFLSFLLFIYSLLDSFEVSRIINLSVLLALLKADSLQLFLLVWFVVKFHNFIGIKEGDAHLGD